MGKQSYSNHRRYVWWYHGLLFGLILVTLTGSVVNLIHSMNGEGNLYSAALLVAVSLLFLFFFYAVRVYALQLQDRIIKAEENFRHMTLTGKPLDHKLHLSQIIALRFAPDDEFPALCERAVKEHLTQEEIKKHIQRWRGDYHRV